MNFYGLFGIIALVGASLASLSGCVLDAGTADHAVAVSGGAGFAQTSEIDQDGWQTVWRDDFDGTRLDRSKWSPEKTCWGGGNNERQCYTSRGRNIAVKDGVLRLRARPERYTGSAVAPGRPASSRHLATRRYTSGKITTRKHVEFLYGRVSARLKLPAGQGTWPAFWMMPADSVYGDWPLSGEIDIMEAVNLRTQCDTCSGGIEQRTSGALHFGDKAPENDYRFLHAEVPGDVGPSEEWRVYSIEWAAGVIQWLVNGEVYMRLESDAWFTASKDAHGKEHAPFEQPFYIILNLAVGGNLAEQFNNGGFDPDSFPAELLVDWVEVEQCTDDIETGLSCISQQDWSGVPMGPWETQAR